MGRFWLRKFVFCVFGAPGGRCGNEWSADDKGRCEHGKVSIDPEMSKL
jgi:hypothetical protein